MERNANSAKTEWYKVIFMYRLYHNNRCSKSRSCLKILNNHNIDFEVIEYLKINLTKSMVEDIVNNLLNPIKDVVRKNEDIYKNSNINLNNKDKVVDFITRHPICLERPIFFDKSKYIICRPPETVMNYIGA